MEAFIVHAAYRAAQPSNPMPNDLATISIISRAAGIVRSSTRRTSIGLGAMLWRRDSPAARVSARE